MKYISYIITLLSIVACVASCTENKSVQQEEQQTAGQKDNPYKLGVNTIDVGKVAGKGKIKSLNTVPIYSVIDGIVSEMSLIEGQRVHKNETLAVIDDYEYNMQLSELESELEKKAFEVKSSLVGIGYNRDSLDTVPVKERDAVEIMTGYAYTKVKYDNLKQLHEKHTIKAPFDGNILDIKINKLFYARKGEPLFYLMDTDNLVVQFEVLENMVSQYSVGMPLEFTTLTFGDRKYSAKLISIAPNVESTGMVLMTASIDGKHPELRPGMTTFINY